MNLSLNGRDLVPGFRFNLSLRNLLDEQGRDEIDMAVGLPEDIPRAGFSAMLTVTWQLKK